MKVLKTNSGSVYGTLGQPYLHFRDPSLGPDFQAVKMGDSTHWNPFTDRERLGVTRVDTLPSSRVHGEPREGSRLQGSLSLSTDLLNGRVEGSEGSQSRRCTRCERGQPSGDPTDISSVFDRVSSLNEFTVSSEFPVPKIKTGTVRECLPESKG